MKLVVGLGNPGEKYESSRHNVGFGVIDELSKSVSVSSWRKKFRAVIGETRILQEKVLLCKPATFMNLSGESVAEVCRFYGSLDVHTDIIVVYDDMDFPPGQVKLRQKGSAGGHNGIKSLISCLGTDEFARVRVGIGRPGPGKDVVSYVLGTFGKEEQIQMDCSIARAAEAVLFSLNHSFDLAMNRFNEATHI
jgi:peptidyl-tRNA hydrolase, PTH1 family